MLLILKAPGWRGAAKNSNGYFSLIQGQKRQESRSLSVTDQQYLLSSLIYAVVLSGVGLNVELSQSSLKIWATSQLSVTCNYLGNFHFSLALSVWYRCPSHSVKQYRLDSVISEQPRVAPYCLEAFQSILLILPKTLELFWKDVRMDILIHFTLKKDEIITESLEEHLHIIK